MTEPRSNNVAPPAVLGASATTLMIDQLSAPFETLPTLEAQAFSCWLQGVYLEALSHMDAQVGQSTLLTRTSLSMINAGASVLLNSQMSAVATTMKNLVSDFDIRSAFPKLRSRDLLSLSVMIPLGPKSKQLLGWVDLAFGDAPKAYRDLVWYGVQIDGSLVPVGQLVEEVDGNLIQVPAWKATPAFWRMLYVASMVYTKQPYAAENVCRDIITRSALPRFPEHRMSFLFSNAIALTNSLIHLFGYAHDGRSQAMLHRFLQPWEGIPIVGSRQADIWLRWIRTLSPDQTDFTDQHLYRRAFNRRVDNQLSETIFTALEAIDPNPDADPDADPNAAPADTDDSSDNTDVSDDSTSPIEDGEESAIPDGLSPDSQVDQNNSIGDISLEQDADPGRAYLYRRSVLALNETLTRDPNVDVSQDVRQALHLWCRDWLWLASVTQTQKLIKDLGLQKALEPVEKKD